jgi:hypothetical protein
VTLKNDFKYIYKIILLEYVHVFEVALISNKCLCLCDRMVMPTSKGKMVCFQEKNSLVKKRNKETQCAQPLVICVAPNVIYVTRISAAWLIPLMSRERPWMDEDISIMRVFCMSCYLSDLWESKFLMHVWRFA